MCLLAYFVTLLSQCHFLCVQLEGKEIIRKVEGTCLAGRLPWMSEGQSPVLQPIRANVSHFKKPWFDSVEVRRLGPRGEEETAYAELRLLFEADVSTAGQWRCQIEYLFN